MQNFSVPYQKQFNKTYPLASKFDYYDNKGNLKPNPLDIFVFGTEDQIQTYKNNFKPKTPTTESVGPNNQSDNPTAPTPGGTRSAVGVIALINAINFGLEITVANNFSEDQGKLTECKSAFQSAYRDLKSALQEPGMIPIHYQNTNDLSEILNVILQGETISGNQDLYQIGINIVDKISGNLHLQLKEIVTIPSGLDNYPSQKYPVYKSKEEMTDPALDR